MSATAFPGARLVVGGTTAEHVLVEHQRSLNDRDIALSLVSLTSGQVTGSLTIGNQVDRAVLGPDGITAIAADNVLVLAGTDGKLVRVEVGATDFFGN